MNKNIYNILSSYFSTCKANEFCFSNAEDLMEKFPHLTDFCDYECGGSKMVLIPYEEDYVIKLPFRGYLNNKDNFIPFVMPLLYNDWDHCKYELYLYHEARKYHVAQPFLKTTFWGYAGIEPIYIQKRIDTSDSYVIRNHNSRNIYYSIFGEEISASEESWYARAYDCYGRETYTNLLKFLNDYDLQIDLRVDNLGYIDEDPVIVDYAGYYG